MSKYSKENPHPDHPFDDWVHEVTNNYTESGYQTWVEHQIEMASVDVQNHVVFIIDRSVVKFSTSDGRTGSEPIGTLFGVGSAIQRIKEGLGIDGTWTEEILE